MPDIADGETAEVQGSAAKPYVLKNVGGVYSCSCPAWRNQSAPIERRTCKHLRKYRGEAAEQERLGGELPVRAQRSAKKGESEGPPILLAQTWDSASDLNDWWMSEKLDGVRAYWDGEKFLSRLGNQYMAPDWFIAGLPKDVLDGELWMDRKKFQRTVSIVRRQDKSDHWKDIRFRVFDAPKQSGGFEDRIAFVEDCLNSNRPEFAEFLPHERCRGSDHLKEELARIESLGGEGLMLRQPDSRYEIGRSFTLLKVKNFYDAEAEVLDYVAGKGKHKGRMGSLQVRLPDGTAFSVGTGFSDAQRANPPEIGSTITFRYQELSDGGVPRFPSFLRAGSASKAGVKKSSSKQPAARKKSAAAGKPTKKKDPPKKKSSSAKLRYFEFSDEKSHKFWEIDHDDLDVTVRYGRIGADGQTKTKSFSDLEKATAHAEKLIEQKTDKGYVETDQPE